MATSIETGQPLVLPAKEERRLDRLMQGAELALAISLLGLFEAQREEIAADPNSARSVVSDFNDHLVTELESGMIRAWELGLAVSAAYEGVSINSLLLLHEGRGYVQGGVPALVQRLNTATIRGVEDIVSVWVKSGAEISKLYPLLEPVYGRSRAEMIAVTEMTNYHTRATLRGYQASRYVTGMFWLTAADDRVCFPAGTMVRTESGDKPIEELKIGEKVLTRKGLRKVLATSKREYSGDMIRVNTPIGSVTSTADHPYWTNENGWVEGRSLTLEQTLQTFEGTPLRIHSLELPFLPTNDSPAASLEKLVFPLVSDGIVPILPVNLKGYPLFWNNEIDTVSTDLNFLNKFLAHRFKLLSGEFFKSILATKTAIASEAAKVLVIARNCAESLLAMLAGLNHWGSAAFLRAVSAVESLFRSELLAASLTGDILGFGSPTGSTANRESLGCACVYGEIFTANRANLRHLVGSGGIVARARTVHPSGFDSGFGAIGFFPAGGTRNVLSGFEFGSVVAHDNDYTPLTKNGEIIQRSSTIVYDIEVEEEHEFYANGILVHNCPICAPLGGLRYDGVEALDTSREEQLQNAVRASLYSSFTHPGGLNKAAKYKGLTFLPAAHPRCRCRIGPVVG